MKRISLFLATITLITFSACKNTTKEARDAEQVRDSVSIEEEDIVIEEPITLAVTMASKSGSSVQGEVLFTEENGRVRMEGSFTGLKPDAKHAIHLHEHGDCSSDDGSSAGGHWNPTDEKHGKWDDHEGYHKGDIGNLKTDANGHADLLFETDQWCIGCGDETKDIIGKSIIVHESADDFVSQPTGDAGGRVSCGESTAR